jgi:hypothetical protein
MGVRRLFSRGGQKFSRTYFLPKNNEKDTIFPPKRIKTYYFWPARMGGGAIAPLCPPLRTPMVLNQIKSEKLKESNKLVVAIYILK